ncbi:MAG: SusC/RagA family TonB-linked outer membrane protein [Flavobacterium psychrophilum]|nr:MAG: SusC/RagA family TonB-linked outer membrane protein [Flavobacterium psychrophilum]
MSLPGLAQRITISQKNAPLRTIFTSIKEQTGISVIYETPLLRNANRVTLQINDLPLQDALKLIFEHQPIRYEYTPGSKVILLFPAPLTSIQSPTQSAAPTGKINIKGRVTTVSGEPVASATVYSKISKQVITTDANGNFSLNDVFSNEQLIVSYVSYETGIIDINGNKELHITLQPQVKELSEVVISTGYQKQSIEKLTGSFSKVNQELLNRRVSTTVLDRLDGVTSSVLFNKNLPNSIQNPSNISIRGRSTIHAYAEPLIILDNFPYTGDVNNINPNDVESITILKDAAAASMWGAYSANGVIVITTKSGKYNQAIKLSVNSNITIGGKPDLYYEPTLTSSEYIDVERFLFDNGYYTNRENDPRQLALSPAVEIMIKERNQTLSSSQATALLNDLRKQDVRRDKENYFYRKSINQQYSISASGGGIYNQYYFSAGYDKNLSSQVGNQYDRVTLNANNTYALLSRKLELTTGIIFSSSQVKQTPPLLLLSPYASLVDANGQALPVNYGMRQPYIDTAGNGRLLDWNLRPLDELRLSNNRTTLTDYRINTGLKYTILKGLSANILYQYNRGFSEQRNLQGFETYFTRNLINQYTQINGDSLITPVPYGSILDKVNQTYQAHNIRVQAEYNYTWSPTHTFNIFAGAELRSLINQISTSRLYGYDPERQTSLPVDYLTGFPLYHTPFYLFKVPNIDKNRRTTDRYISYFVNAAYTIKKRYTISISSRKDESNIFGVKTNQKGIPLWSAGASWELSKESFYQQGNWLPYLRFRITHGYNGNVDRSVSAFTTASMLGMNNYGALPGSIINPPNPALRWERIQMTNIGIDFTSINGIISGSLEYYHRRAEDLIGSSPLDPTTGNANFRGNTANMKGNGVDITINTQNINKKYFKWISTILFSYTQDEVTDYKVQLSAIGSYLNPDEFNPLKGRPLYSVYSLQWMGLDPITGDPQGLLDNEVSKDYRAILNSTNFNDLQYYGPANPVLFGSVRNTVEIKRFQLSFNIMYKAGYYFRRPTINYNELLDGYWGHTDYLKRWQKPGDEAKTYIPSMRYPNNEQRNNFYTFSNVLVEKGDHIRLQDIRLSYSFNKHNIKRFPMQGLELYVYANNIGILWKANNQDIDPDYISGIPAPLSIAGGVKIDF